VVIQATHVRRRRAEPGFAARHSAAGELSRRRQGPDRRPSGAEFAKGHWYEPTVVADVRNDMEIMQREVFGPVIPAMTVTDFAEGLALANDSAYGLSAYVFTKDLRRLMRLVRELKFGEIYVNRAGGDAVHAYHSGYRHSGIGGEDGKYGLEGCLRKKTIYVNYS
jgi:lactaldehyde dehydrogenase/glycolaldehyde dehydrogenase